MNIKEVYNSKSVAIVHEKAASNSIAYLGEALFPKKKKASLDLKWIKASKGLPVSLMPSAFDTKSTIRSREGFSITETEMPYFKESMILKEKEEQDIMRAQNASDVFGKEALDTIYNDAETLVAGANVVPERMIWQLLANEDGKPQISISADGATYAINYDPNGDYAANNYETLSGTSKWSDTDDSDPMQDISDAQDAVEEKTGTRPDTLVVSKKTMGYLKANKKVQGYILGQSSTATVMITDARVKEIFKTELGVAIIVYAKQFKDETGTAKKFYPDGMATLLPNGELGNTWYGMTPEERTLVMKPDADVTIVDTGVAVAVTISDDPVHTKTTVSEITLPSFERIDETYQIKCY